MPQKSRETGLSHMMVNSFLFEMPQNREFKFWVHLQFENWSCGIISNARFLICSKYFKRPIFQHPKSNRKMGHFKYFEHIGNRAFRIIKTGDQFSNSKWTEN